MSRLRALVLILTKMEHYEISPKALFSFFYPRLCHFAWQLLHDDELVQDVVQDAFLALWENLESLNAEPTAVKNYLYSTVRNACYNIKRHDKVVRRYQTMNPFDEIQEPSVDRQLIRSEVMGEVYKIMTEMPDSCRKIFRLGYLEGLSNVEVSKMLKISVSTVKTQKQRAIDLIKSKLNPEFFGLFLFFYQNN